MKYAKIVGTFLNFQNGDRLGTGIQYSRQETKMTERQILIQTYENDRIINTIFALEGADLLDFTSKSDDPRIPVIKGRFLNSDYEESLINCSLKDKGIDISGVVTKLDQTHALSIKTLTESSSRKIVGVIQERIELISESAFKMAVNLR